MLTLQELGLEPGFVLHSQMTPCERFALSGLLERLKPTVALEIGTYKGGSLQFLARNSEAVISLDIDPGIPTRLAGKFPNVEFRSGDSHQLLSDLVREMNEQKRPLGFVLVDGDHSTEGVKQDIEQLLNLQPQREIVILLHDSFNPACREGMRRANWASCPFVHQVDLDFIPGIYHYEAHDTAAPRTMWGGFACALLAPEKRIAPLIVQESQQPLYEAVKSVSTHVRQNLWGRLRRGIETLLRQ